MEEGLGRQLLERTPRKVTLSLHGQAFLDSGILAIGAAVGAGIGIGAMVGRMAPAGCVDVSERFALPPLPSRDVVLYTAQRDAQAQQLIRTLSADIAGG